MEWKDALYLEVIFFMFDLFNLMHFIRGRTIMNISMSIFYVVHDTGDFPPFWIQDVLGLDYSLYIISPHHVS